MRLLSASANGSFRLTNFIGSDIPSYAILSHTWEADDQEVSYHDLINSLGSSKKGHRKFQFCAEQAERDGLRYFWIDSCCIDKSSSAELQTAINSMFRWYQNAAKCYVYLSDVSIGKDPALPDLPWERAFRKSRWFTRGWTLQELLAPRSVEFFSQEGKRLGNKDSLKQQIHEITAIPVKALHGHLSQFNDDEKAFWAAKRETTIEEDQVYCLLGIFNVYLPLLYGEGKDHALRRLKDEAEKRQLRDDTGKPSGVTPRYSAAQSEKAKEILRRLNVSPYRDRKDRNPDRVPGTCEWFVSHKLFLDWNESKSARMLWVSADPGCGKSVLAKHLVDSVLSAAESKTTCYFFFKDIKDQKSVASALCCILHQLFTQKRFLLSDAILDQIDISGEQFTNSFDELWQTLIQAAEGKNAGEIICLLDAIDECEDQGRSQLTEALCKLYNTTRNFNLKFLLTSRPYDGIRRGFQPLNIPGLPVIHLSGESDVEMEKISREIDEFISVKALHIGERLKLTHNEQGLLLEQLMRIPNRTYLWVHLTLDLIEKSIGIDKAGIVEATSHLPQTVDEAYDRILSKSCNPTMAKKILHIVVAAARPLTLREMNLALALKESHRSYGDLDLRPEERFRNDVRDFCGLFVTVIDSRIYLLHQTAKEFLVQTAAMKPPKPIYGNLEWKGSVRLQESHRILGDICIWHLLFTEFETGPFDGSGPLSQYVEDHIFLDYSAKHWAAHLRELQVGIQDAMTESILKICDTRSRRWPTWFRVYWTSTDTDFPSGFTILMVASYFGLGTVVRHLLKTDVDLDSRDSTYERSALSWAAGNGFDVVVKLLIKAAGIGLKRFKLPFGKGAVVNSVDTHGRTPLSYAVWNGNVAVVKLLIKAGARADLEDHIGGTPLSYALCNGNKELVELLLKRRTQIGSEIDMRKKLLLSAAQQGHEAVIKLLLEAKADIDSKSTSGQTPLSLAAKEGHEAVVRLLLEAKADIHSRDKDFDWTPLSWAAWRGREAIVKLLVDTGKADINSKSTTGQTPLSLAAWKGHEAVVRLLLEAMADVESKDKNGQTPLSLAAEEGHEAVVRLLVDTGKADVDSKDRSFGRTPLSWAAWNGHKAVVKLLLEGGADVNSKDHSSRTPLSWAAESGREAVAKLLLATGNVDVDSKDMDADSGRTPLLWAAQRGFETVVKLLLATGNVNVNSKDNKGRTSLSWAAAYGHEAVVKLLLATRKVNVDSKDHSGRTPLSWAAENGQEAVVKLLLESNVDVDSKDHSGRTPLSWAAENGQEAVVKLLLEGNVDVDSKNHSGRTPHSWAAENGHEVVVKLLMDRAKADIESMNENGQTPL
jgi:ankyrin repeat protein